MIEQSGSMTRGEERLLQARHAIELASDIYDGINQEVLPGTEISQHDLTRKGPKNQFSDSIDFMRDFMRGFDRESLDAPIEREFVWILEKSPLPSKKTILGNSYFEDEGFMLGTFGKLIKFRHGKFDNYTILNENTIEEPAHLIKLLGKFAFDNFIRYSAR